MKSYCAQDLKRIIIGSIPGLSLISDVMYMSLSFAILFRLLARYQEFKGGTLIQFDQVRT